MDLFRRKRRAPEPSLAEIEAAPEYREAQAEVDHAAPPAPSGEPYFNAVFGSRPQIVDVTPPDDEASRG